MRKIIWLTALMIIACAPSVPAWWDVNRMNLLKISPGMSSDQLIEIMGLPYQNEAFTTEDQSFIEAYIYRTEWDWDGIKWVWTTVPVVLVNNKIVGWGWSFYRGTTLEYDIDIEIKGEAP